MDNFGARLQREAEAWVREGLITPDQAARLAARYRAGGAPSRLIGIITLLGGALIASGLALVIAHNWERLSDWTKIAGLLVLMAGFYLGGYELRERGFARAGDSLLMIGAALFLCGIALVAQIFHLNSRPPNGVLLWLLAILPLAYLIGSGPVLFLGLAGGVIWIGMEAGSPDSLLYIGVRGGATHDPFDLLFGNWVGMMALFAAVGVALIAGGALHVGKYKKFERVYDLLGLLLFGTNLYSLTFLRHDGGTTPDIYEAALTPVLLFALLGGALAVMAWKTYPAAPPRTRDIQVGVLLLGLVFAVAPALAIRLHLRGVWFDEVYSFLCAVYLLGAAMAFISAGSRWDRPGWVNLGLLLVGINVITRYFDLVGTMLEGGLLFISGGILILFLGILLEKQRRRLMRRMAMGGAA